MSNDMTTMNEMHDRMQTSKTDLAAFLLAEGYRLLEITGPPYQRQFRFDRPITPEVTTRFYSSREKQVIDHFRSLKSALINSD
jgi:hypothetical protein